MVLMNLLPSYSACNSASVFLSPENRGDGSRALLRDEVKGTEMGAHVARK